MTKHLTLSADDMRRLGYRVIDLIVDHLEFLPHSTALNTCASNWTEASGAAELERLTVSWLAQLCGMPDEAGGTFLSGGYRCRLSA